MTEFDDSDLDVDDASIDRSRRAVGELLSAANLHLDDEALWAEPSADLEERIMADLEEPATVTSIWSARSIRWLAPIAAVAAAAVIFVTAGGSPDWEVALGATDAAPGASAVVAGWNEEDGTRVELTVDGLEPAPEGFIYELWFSDEDIHISAGTFHGTGDGVTLWAGVGRRDFPRIWITLEPIDNDPSPGVNILDTAVLET